MKRVLAIVLCVMMVGSVFAMAISASAAEEENAPVAAVATDELGETYVTDETTAETVVTDETVVTVETTVETTAERDHHFYSAHYRCYHCRYYRCYYRSYRGSGEEGFSQDRRQYVAVDRHRHLRCCSCRDHHHLRCKEEGKIIKR